MNTYEIYIPLILCIMSLCIIKLKCFETRSDYIKFVIDFDIAYSVFLLMLFSYHYTTYSETVCEYPNDCHEGLNDTLRAEIYHYKTTGKCNELSHEVDSFYENNIESDEECETSSFGCCLLPVYCQTAIMNGLSYSSFSQTYSSDSTSGYINTGVVQTEWSGEKCPTYIDIFQDKIWREELSLIIKISILVGCYFTVTVVSYLIFKYCSKKPIRFEKVQKSYSSSV